MTARSLVMGALVAVLAGGASAAPRDAERPPQVVERPSKPTGPIAVDYRIAGEPVIGVPLTVIVTARAAGAATLALEAAAARPGALQVGSPMLVAAEEGRFEWTLSVVPFEGDAGFVNVLVSGKIDSVDQARSIAIPVRVAAERPARRLPDSEGGENLIALPVDEAR